MMEFACFKGAASMSGAFDTVEGHTGAAEDIPHPSDVPAGGSDFLFFETCFSPFESPDLEKLSTTGVKSADTAPPISRLCLITTMSACRSARSSFNLELLLFIFLFSSTLSPSGFLAANFACTKLTSALKRLANSKESSSRDSLIAVKVEGFLLSVLLP